MTPSAQLIRDAERAYAFVPNAYTFAVLNAAHRFAKDRDGYLIKDSWTICPSCGIGPGMDHKPGCDVGKKPFPRPVSREPLKRRPL